jgi:anti-sigma B factor antagonist
VSDPRAPALDLEIVESAGTVLVAPLGDLDMATAEELAVGALRELDRSPAAMTINMRRVAFCDSAGINVLVRIRNACERAGTAFRVVEPQPHVRVLLEITGVTEFLNVDPPAPSD